MTSHRSTGDERCRGAAGHEAVPGAGTTAAGAAIVALAENIADRLAALRRELEPVRTARSGEQAGLDAEAEWTVAADGLFGRDGIVGIVTAAMTEPWPGRADAGWAGVTGGPSGPPART